jgi:ABC-type branched-subunit amino acid transport system substrate-binding protein
MMLTQQRVVRARRAAPAGGRARTAVRVNAAAWVNPLRDEVREAARHIAQPGKGILASDESNATTGKRLNAVGVENTETNRRDWRELLYTTPGLGNSISGAILFEETLYQKAADGRQFVDILRDAGIIAGIKVDTGLQVKSELFNAEATKGGMRWGGREGLRSAPKGPAAAPVGAAAAAAFFLCFRPGPRHRHGDLSHVL